MGAPEEKEPQMVQARTRRRAVDARFVIGAVLVVASIAGVAATVGALDSSVLVYSAARPLSVGDRLDTADLAVSEVQLGASEREYLRAESLPETGSVVLKAIEPGELIPLSSLGSVDGVDSASVVVQTGAALPRDVRTGASVDVWSAPLEELGAYGPPRVLVTDATVVRTIESANSTSEATVELLVPRDDIAEVLSAVANADAVSLVPSGLALAEAS
jgi:hypothetical protein